VLSRVSWIQHAATAMIILGLCALMAGWSFYSPSSGRNNLHSPSFGKDDYRLQQGMPRGAFTVEASEAKAHPDGMQRHFLIQVLLSNRLAQSVTILGSDNRCGSSGCISIVLESPKRIASGQSQWIEIDAKWIEHSDTSLFLRLFTDTSVAPTIDLEILPPTETDESELVKLMYLSGGNDPSGGFGKN
jgi:hypothetical protein